jgi:hypothetical protein
MLRNYLKVVLRNMGRSRIAAGLDAILPWDFRVVDPDDLTLADINGIHHAPGAAYIHDPVHHDGGGLNSPIHPKIDAPGKAQLTDIFLGCFRYVQSIVKKKRTCTFRAIFPDELADAFSGFLLKFLMEMRPAVPHW